MYDTTGFSNKEICYILQLRETKLELPTPSHIGGTVVRSFRFPEPISPVPPHVPLWVPHVLFAGL
jgi:hypothetical protein